MSYKHFTRDQRVELYALLKAGISKIQIAKQLGLHRSTIWREIKRNSKEKRYDPRISHPMLCRRRRKTNNKGNKIMNNKKLKSYTEKG